MHLLSRFAAHSHLSALTPHALSSLFAPLLFDIPTATPAIKSHAAFVRAASATEHFLLSYIRSTASGKDGLGLSDLPSRLKEWVSGYPAMLATDADLARGGPRRGARVVRCERAFRTVRAYSKDLIVQAESWAADIPGEWEAWDRVILHDRRGDAGRAKFAPSWRRRMAVKEVLPLPKSTSAPSNLERPMSYGRAKRPGQHDERRQSGTEDDEEGRWNSLAGKEWSMFEEGGFDAPMLSNLEPDDMRSRLQFDLNESAKIVSHHFPFRARQLNVSLEHLRTSKNDGLDRFRRSFWRVQPHRASSRHLTLICPSIRNPNQRLAAGTRGTP